MSYRHFLFAVAVVLMPAVEFEPGKSVLAVTTVHAQQMGNQPWSFTPRSRSMAAQFDFQRRLGSGSSAGSDGMAALQQYVTQYNSSSTSIGNLNEVTQILSGGSNGHVGQSTSQSANGDQGSSATTDTTVNNTSNHVSGGQGTSSSQAQGSNSAVNSDSPAPQVAPNPVTQNQAQAN